MDIAEHSVAADVRYRDAVVAEQGDCIGVQRKSNRAFNAIAKGIFVETKRPLWAAASATTLFDAELPDLDTGCSGIRPKLRPNTPRMPAVKLMRKPAVVLAYRRFPAHSPAAAKDYPDQCIPYFISVTLLVMKAETPRGSCRQPE